MADPQQIVVAGDWHGNSSWAFGVIRRLPELLPDENPRIIIHCGDFGIWPGVSGAQYVHKLDRLLAEVNGVIWFVDGNHEAHPRLAAAERDEAGRGIFGDRIRHLPRGHRWDWCGQAWLALGGAVSLDKAGRAEGKTWWPGEAITAGQAITVIDGGPADVMVTHDCPALVTHTFPAPPSWWDRGDLIRNEHHRGVLQALVDSVKPSYLMHGHLHRAYARTVQMSHGDVQVTGFDCDGSERGNWAVLNVETMEWGIAHGQ